jgi:RNA polymerase sigma factor (sigma-70 family)
VTSEPFERVVEAHGAVVLRVCRALLRPADADDAWAETFVSALRAYPSLVDGSNVRGWLVTIAHRKAIDVMRRRERLPQPVARVPDRAGLAVGDDPPDERLRRALSRLTDRQRDAVVLHHVSGFTYAEIADALGTTSTAARRNASDGIAAMRRLLGEEPNDD